MNDQPQPTLFDSDNKLTIENRFLRFHAANPEVYDELVRLARQGKSAGYHRLGIKQLFEVLRWHRMMIARDAAEEYKLNNNYHSRYARLIMEAEPDLAEIFELRELKAP